MNLSFHQIPKSAAYAPMNFLLHIEIIISRWLRRNRNTIQLHAHEVPSRARSRFHMQLESFHASCIWFVSPVPPAAIHFVCKYCWRAVARLLLGWRHFGPFASSPFLVQCAKTETLQLVQVPVPAMMARVWTEPGMATQRTWKLLFEIYVFILFHFNHGA